MAVIIKAFRSPITRAHKGALRHIRSDDLAVTVIKHICDNTPELDPKLIDDIIVGCANPEGEQGLQVGRMISLMSLGIEVPGMTINRYCASGLEAIALATSKIRAGMGDVFIAGGIETMSMIPMTGYKLSPNYQIANHTPEYIVSMGTTAEAVGRKYEINREEADTFAVESHKKAHSAQIEGRFQSQIVPIPTHEIFVQNDTRCVKNTIVDSDGGIRPDTSVEALKKLKPSFSSKGTVTAGNSSQMSDGASFALVMSEKMASKLGLQPLGQLLSYTVAGVEPLYMGIGPVMAIPKALKEASVKLNDIEQIELNEAFATQALAVINESNLNPEIINVNGGAIALGHPLGCTGAKLSTQLLHEMTMRSQRYGMVTACVGGGQGVAAVFEKL